MFPIILIKKKFFTNDVIIIYQLKNFNFELHYFSKTLLNLGALEIQSVGKNGLIRFFSPSTDLFLAMNEHGRLYGTVSYNNNCKQIKMELGHCYFSPKRIPLFAHCGV